MRRSILSAIDQRLTSSSRLNFQRSNVKIARAHGVGPSAILNVEWKDQYFSIDIVACVRGTDVSGLRYVEEVENFIHSVEIGRATRLNSSHMSESRMPSSA